MSPFSHPTELHSNGGPMIETPVFVWKTDSGQVGRGLYPMVGCFIGIGVHVPFTFETHGEDKVLQDVGEPVKCDRSCMNHPGHLEDFGPSIKRLDSDYGVSRIVERAHSASFP